MPSEDAAVSLGTAAALAEAGVTAGPSGQRTITPMAAQRGRDWQGAGRGGRLSTRGSASDHSICPDFQCHPAIVAANFN